MELLAYRDSQRSLPKELRKLAFSNVDSLHVDNALLILEDQQGLSWLL